MGFNLFFFGKENVYINGVILGLLWCEIDRCFDEILEFLELGEFIYVFLKIYSFGMCVWFGYLVVVYLELSFLLLDEVFVVGDVGFWMKCFDYFVKLWDCGIFIIIVFYVMGVFFCIV